jgi:methyltransferase (TIGR00027 family)
MRKDAAAFYGLCTLMSPVIVAGYVVWVSRTITSGRSGVSGTAQGPLSARFSEHQFGTRPDEAADRLIRVVPGIPPLGLRLTTGPVLLAHRLTGYVPRAFRYPFEGEVSPQYEASARIAYFDSVLRRYRPTVSQFVVLGAGFDTRAYGGLGLRAFEVDTPATQQVKREALRAAGIDAAAVTFVSADFQTEDWLARLVAAGFDRAARTVFLWEGVTMYLDRAAVEDTLRKIASTAAGSVVTFDHFTTVPLESGAPYWRFARVATRSSGEALRFGVDSDRLAGLLAACGLELTDQCPLGDWGGFATATVIA